MEKSKVAGLWSEYKLVKISIGEKVQKIKTEIQVPGESAQWVDHPYLSSADQVLAVYYLDEKQTKIEEIKDLFLLNSFRIPGSAEVKFKLAVIGGNSSW